VNGPVTARVRPVPHPLRPVRSAPGRRMTIGGKVHWGLQRTAGAGSAAAAAWLWTVRRPPAAVRDVDRANPRRVIELRDCVLALRPGAAASPAAQPDTPRRWHTGVRRAVESPTPGSPPTPAHSARFRPCCTADFQPGTGRRQGRPGTRRVQRRGQRLRPADLSSSSRRDVRAAAGACGGSDGTGPHPWCGGAGLSGGVGISRCGRLPPAAAGARCGHRGRAGGRRSWSTRWRG